MSNTRLLTAFLTGITLAPLPCAGAQLPARSDISSPALSPAPSLSPSSLRQSRATMSMAMPTADSPANPTIYNARNGQTDVKLGPPRADSVVIDGKLDEEVWQTAPTLTGFSQYAPVDGRPAPDSTEVRVWYSEHAIYFGIRAFEPHGEVRATLADRDRVSSDDYVEIHLDPFQEQRRAFVFIVNPLGIQADGTKSELGGYIPGSNVMPGQNDLSADFIWQSNGRITEWGYEVEVRIPYNSLRFPSHSTQRWGVQFSRTTQHSGYETTWTPVARGAASFIAQQGYLSGMTGLKRGVDLLVNPELTTTIEGSPDNSTQASTKWSYTNSPTIGGNIRAGLGSNFVLNGTFKPDFSQVEADATQVAADQRFALFYAERRPFFVEGSDAFNVPNTLVYTRTIVRPTAAAKLTGRLGRANLAILSAYDAPPGVASDVKSLVNILRITRDFSKQSVAGMLYSDRVSDVHTNRLLGADIRHVFGEKYYAQLQYASSFSEQVGQKSSGSLWEGAVDRTGRAWGFHYNLIGIQPGFRSDNGFVSRTGFVKPASSNRLTIFGKPGSAFEQYQLFGSANALWQYNDFFSGASVLEATGSASSTVTFRHGWSLGYTPEVSSYAFTSQALSGLYASSTSLPSLPALVESPPRITTFTHRVSLGTPQFQRFAANISAGVGKDVDFAEAAKVRRTSLSGSMDWRPDSKLRVNATYASNEFNRRLDGRLSYSTQIPRVKIEYQMTRSVFVRLVTQYEATRREALRDWKTGEILLTQLADGRFVPVSATRSNVLQADLLFSYRPSPGTVFFAGYGSVMTEPDALSFSQLERASDGLFVKLSWVMRTASR